MVDIHCHILWGLDDGAKSFDDSVAMARLAADSGTTDIVATPHANNQYAFDPERIASRIAELSGALDGRIRIHSGCDFHLSFGNIESALEDPRYFTVNHSRYLMVELPEVIIPPEMGTVFERMNHVGILPVITHPERNRALWRNPAQFNDWIDAGAYVQITAQSLDAHFGRTARDVAWRLLDENKVHFIASDGHDLEFRPPRLDVAFVAVAKKYGDQLARSLFVDNPQCVLEGRRIPAPAPRAKTRSRLWPFR